MKRTGFFARAFLLTLLLACMTAPAYADAGPKPSVAIDFEGLEGRECYATLLSTVQSVGPYTSSVKEQPDGTRYYDGTETGVYWVRESPFYTAIWERFMDYQLNDPEKLYFMEEFSAPDEKEQFSWSYYPPNTFKILLYFPETDSFAVTPELLDRYAFHSRFTVDLTGLELVPGETVSSLTAVRSYDYTGEALGLLARAAITIALEAALAWTAFKLRAPRQLALILLVNLVTQLCLNLGLNWYAYLNGPMDLFLPYLLMELAVVAVELTAYALWMPGLAPSKKGRLKAIGGYTLAANVLSLAAGWLLVLAIPGIF